MAFTSTLLFTTRFGNKKIKAFSYTSTAVTTGSITTGFGVITKSIWTPKTIRDAATLNDTTTAGTVTLAGLTAGDTGYILVIGR